MGDTPKEPWVMRPSGVRLSSRIGLALVLKDQIFSVQRHFRPGETPPPPESDRLFRLSFTIFKRAVRRALNLLVVMAVALCIAGSSRAGTSTFEATPGAGAGLYLLPDPQGFFLPNNTSWFRVGPRQLPADWWADPMIKQLWLFHHADYYAWAYTPYTDVLHSEWINGELWDDNTGEVEDR